jgi:ABC-type bacteriocin/lantibiotic exporter with double-glycine peptidase domain
MTLSVDGTVLIKLRIEMGSITSVYRLFTVAERAKLGILVILIVVGGFLEVFGVGVLFPYVAILQDPSRIAHMNYIGTLYRWASINSNQTFIVGMSIGLLALFCFKALFTIFLANYQLRLVNDIQTQLGQRLMAHYLRSPYEFFLSTNTATLIGNLTTSVVQLSSGVIQSALLLTAEVVSFLGLLTFLVWLSPAFSLIAFVFAVAMAFTFLGVIRTRVAHYAIENDVRWKAMIRKVNEAFNGVKEIKVLGRAQYFVDAYSRESRALAFAVRRNSVLSQVPRVALETSAVAMLVAFAVFTIARDQAGADVFPILAVFAAATVRIVPNVNRIIQAWNSISFHKPAIGIVVSSLGGVSEPATESLCEPVAALPLRRTLSLAVNSFAHRGNQHFRLQDIELNVERGEKIAIIGHSGSGKSTLMDLMLGLFPGFNGSLVVDGVDCRGREAEWQRTIGHVPQSVVMIDDSIKHNVAFGIATADIDDEAVNRAISLAGLDRVVRTQPAGLDTVIGDRGIRLSGGERQRIGIARALYSDPTLLILDEATSALDNQTERQIVDSILALSPAKTIVIIAHRLSSVKLCDRVYLMNAGRIIDTGSFHEIASRHPDFVDPQSTIDQETLFKAGRPPAMNL